MQVRSCLEVRFRTQMSRLCGSWHASSSFVSLDGSGHGSGSRCELSSHAPSQRSVLVALDSVPVAVNMQLWGFEVDAFLGRLRVAPAFLARSTFRLEAPVDGSVLNVSITSLFEAGRGMRVSKVFKWWSTPQPPSPVARVDSVTSLNSADLFCIVNEPDVLDSRYSLEVIVELSSAVSTSDLRVVRSPRPSIRVHGLSPATTYNGTVVINNGWGLSEPHQFHV